ncbi:NACHT domain-containing protein [Planomonospora sp. ID91781]|uniref:AfsR/SARP family transcriptional regulator n=1 Tax=Planomonospora sp. ID91781 TaxID=2738135 RepID=UPI0018C40464|nr:BTAD domain-containing putative transcriptional regulator [Planomonospora sp. ID91781]MBG0825891.1 NACHT domain-containing protein [Planomonospora sp. ID91781]
MRFAILGQTAVADAENLNLTLLQRRAIAALVAAELIGRRRGLPPEHRGLSAERLMQAIWQDYADHANSLKTLLSGLRARLGERLPKGSDGRYRIVLDPADTVDALDFRALLENAETAMGAGEPLSAVTILQEAVDLWSGPPLADVPEQVDQLRAWSEELLRDRGTAVALLLQTRLELGGDHHHGLVADVEQALADDPSSEPLHALLMRALARAGQYARALQYFATAEARLREETGYGPGPHLRQVRDEIAAEAETAAAPAPAPPVMTPALKQLPPALWDFTGRQSEITELVQWLTPQHGRRGVPIVNISGPPGVGKSTLAIQVAHELSSDYEDQIWVPMGAMSGKPRALADVLAELLGTLGVTSRNVPPSLHERSMLVRSILAGRRVLLVIDDVAELHQVQALLPGTAGSAVILTSRKRMVDSGVRSLLLHPMGIEEARALLEEIIGRQRVAAEPEGAKELIRACSGLPLALQISGARLVIQDSWRIADLAARLHELSEFSVGGKTIIASLAESYTALPEPAQRAFRVLSLAGSDWPTWLATMLLTTGDAGPLLETLVLHNLLTTAGVDAIGQPRYRFHDVLREYAALQLTEHPSDHDLALQQLLLGWLELVSVAAAATPGEFHFPSARAITPRTFAPAVVCDLITTDPDGWYDAECGNIVTVTRLACQYERYRLAYGLASRLSAYLIREERLQEAEDLWREIVQISADAGDANVTAQARLRLAWLIMQQPGQSERAVPLADTCITVFTDQSDHQGLSRALAMRAEAHYHMAAEAHDDAEDTGTPPAHRSDHRIANHLAQAVNDAQQARELSRTLATRQTELVSTWILAMVASLQADGTAAVEYADEAMKLGIAHSAEHSDRSYEMHALYAVATAALTCARYQAAYEACESGRALAQAIRHRTAEARFVEKRGDVLTAMIRCAREKGDERAAEEHRKAALAAYREASHVYSGDLVDAHRHRCMKKMIKADALRPVL